MRVAAYFFLLNWTLEKAVHFILQATFSLLINNDERHINKMAVRRNKNTFFIIVSFKYYQVL